VGKSGHPGPNVYQLARASIEGDVDTIANSMTDDYVQTDINGYRQDKATWLNEYFKPLANLIKAGKFHWDEHERRNLQFRFYGDCAIVTGELELKGTGAKFGPQHTWVADPNATFSGIFLGLQQNLLGSSGGVVSRPLFDAQERQVNCTKGLRFVSVSLDGDLFPP